nr:hypothetical protein [Vibrio splendidus]
MRLPVGRCLWQVHISARISATSGEHFNTVKKKLKTIGLEVDGKNDLTSVANNWCELAWVAALVTFEWNFLPE